MSETAVFTNDPLCPWCGESVSDDPDEDFVGALMLTTCATCKQSVVVETEWRALRVARKAYEVDN
jgi:hypothetical protein